jgi:hypothetical protein
VITAQQDVLGQLEDVKRAVRLAGLQEPAEVRSFRTRNLTLLKTRVRKTWQIRADESVKRATAVSVCCACAVRNVSSPHSFLINSSETSSPDNPPQKRSRSFRSNTTAWPDIGLKKITAVAEAVLGRLVSFFSPSLEQYPWLSHHLIPFAGSDRRRRRVCDTSK